VRIAVVNLFIESTPGWPSWRKDRRPLQVTFKDQNREEGEHGPGVWPRWGGSKLHERDQKDPSVGRPVHGHRKGPYLQQHDSHSGENRENSQLEITEEFLRLNFIVLEVSFW